MKAKRVLCAILAAIMTGTMLSACGGKPTNTSSVASAPATESDAAPGNDENSDTEDPASEGETSADADSEGTGSTVGASGNSSTGGKTPAKKPITDLKKRNIRIMLYGAIENFTDSVEGIYYESFKEIAKKYNCKFTIEEMPINDLIAKVEQAKMAGNAPFDVAMVEGYHVIPQQALSGNYLCLSDYYDFNDGVWNNSVMTGVGEFNNKRYAFPIGLTESVGLYYNKALLKAANQKDPWEYVKNNTWNWTNFKAMAKALTKDSNKDGKNDQYGFCSEEPYLQFILGNGGRVIDTSSGKGKWAVGEPKSMEAINFVNNLFDEKIMPAPEDLANIGAESYFQAMKTGQMAMFTYHVGYGPWLMDEAKMKANDVGWVYFPKGPKASGYVSPTLTDPNMLMVLKNTKQPEEVVTVMQDAMAFWSKNHKSARTVPQVRTDLAQRDAYLDFLTGNHLKMYQDLANKNVCTNTYNYSDASTLIRTMFYEIRTKKYTPQAGLDAYKSAISKAITAAETVE